MKARAPYLIFGLVLFIAAFFRLTHLDWDAYNHYHPDERYITWIATSIEWPVDWAEAFKPQKSTFNPFYWPANAQSDGLVLEQDTPRRFAYGHLPLYLGVAATRITEALEPALTNLLPNQWSLTQDILNLSGRNEFRHITAVSRALTAFVDLLSVGLVFILGKELFSIWAGVLGATFLSLNVMHIQIAHFFAVDPYLTFFVLLTLTILAISLRESRTPRSQLIFLILAAIGLGLAVGSKFTGILLFLPLSFAILLQRDRTFKKRVAIFLATGLVSFLTFAITNPFAILDQSCSIDFPTRFGPIQIPDEWLSSCYLQNVGAQASMVQGIRDVPFVRQYEGTMPFIYFIEMQLRWGMGFFLGFAAFSGLGWAIWRGGLVITKWWPKREFLLLSSQWLTEAKFPFKPSEMVLLSWTIPFFITTGGLDVKFMRYLEPLTPFLMIYAAAMLLSIRQSAIRWLAIGLVLISTSLYAFAFINLYRDPHPWISASRWIFDHVEEGAVIVNEMWDDPLPDVNTFPGDLNQRKEFILSEVNWLSGTEEADNWSKLEENLAVIAKADFVVIASNRNYGTISRLPERYPSSAQYYPKLFAGDLGYEIVYVGTRMPNLFGFHVKPDSFEWPNLTEPTVVSNFLTNLPGLNLGRFDESFTVYDQPLVMILQNKDGLSVEELTNKFSK